MARQLGGMQTEVGNGLHSFSPATDIAVQSMEFRENQSYRPEMNYRYMAERSNTAAPQGKQHPPQEAALYLRASPVLDVAPPLPVGIHRLPAQPAPVRRDALALPHAAYHSNNGGIKIRQINIQLLTAASNTNDRSGAENSSAKLLCSLDDKLISLDEAQAIISDMTNVDPVIANIIGRNVFPNAEFHCATSVQSTEDNLTNLHSKIMDLSKINKMRLLNSVASADCAKTVQQRTESHHPMPPVSFEPSDTHYTQRMLVNYSPVTPPTEAPATPQLAALLDESSNIQLIQSNYKERVSRAMEGRNAEQSGPTRASKTRRQKKSKNKDPEPSEARNISAIPNQYYVSHADRNFDAHENPLQHHERLFNDGQRNNVMTTGYSYMDMPDSPYARQRNHPKQTYGYFHPRFNGYVSMDINTSRAAIQQQQMVQRAMAQECEEPPQQHYGNVPPRNGPWVIRAQPAQMPNVPDTWQNNRNPSAYADVHDNRPNNNMYFANCSHARFTHEPDI